MTGAREPASVVAQPRRSSNHFDHAFRRENKTSTHGTSTDHRRIKVFSSSAAEPLAVCAHDLGGRCGWGHKTSRRPTHDARSRRLVRSRRAGHSRHHAVENSINTRDNEFAAYEAATELLLHPGL